MVCTRTGCVLKFAHVFLVLIDYPVKKKKKNRMQKICELLAFKFTISYVTFIWSNIWISADITFSFVFFSTIKFY